MDKQENNRPSSGMEEIYKDFAIIHAGAESALNLLRGLDEKLKKAIAVNSPTPGDGDRYYQFYALRMNCLDCTMALLRQFDSGFGQDILIGAEVENLIEEEDAEGGAIADEFEAEGGIQEANEANYEKEKAITDEDSSPWDLEIPPTWLSLGPREDEMRNLLLRLAKALGKEHLPLNLRTMENYEEHRRDRLSEVLEKLVAIAERNANRQRLKNLALDQSLRKIYLMVIPLLNLRGVGDDDEDIQENSDTLISSAQEILELTLKEIREASIPF